MSKNKKEVRRKVYDASPSRRFLAYLIDWYVGALATAVPISMIAQKMYGQMERQDIIFFDKPYGLIAGILALICAFLYYVIVPMFVNKGQTFGKKLCKIKIVKMDNSDLSFKDYLLRQVLGIVIVEGVLYSASSILHQVIALTTGINIVKPMMYLGFVIGGVSFLLALFRNDHRAIHDHIAGTKVISFEEE